MKKLHFLDSGAHTWINWVRKSQVGGVMDFSIYDTPEFKQYVDEYAAFVKKYKDSIDYYANVDVIQNPKLTWKWQKYLENEHGLNPIPVVHFGAALHVLDRYLDAGYDYIALGGRIGRLPYIPWADGIWNVICSGPSKMPTVKVHGFSVTTHHLILRYPWWSVDSTTHRKMAYHGQILVPYVNQHTGEFCFNTPNMVLFMDPTRKYTITTLKQKRQRHFLSLPRQLQKRYMDWFEEIGVPYGARNKKGEVTEIGLTTHEGPRQAATIEYYTRLVQTLPDWPWPFLQSSRPRLRNAIYGQRN